TRSRLLYETGLEVKAMAKLRAAKKRGSLEAMSEAEAILKHAMTDGVSTRWRARVFELAEALYRSIGMQLSVPLYKAIAVDRGARYKLRVVYASDVPSRKIRLVANGNIEIHPFMAKPTPPKAIEFDIPAEATKRGELTLSWFREQGLGDNGRGCHVAEVWLV